jgi:hypothetical protein
VVVNHLRELDDFEKDRSARNVHFELLSDRLGMINLGRLRESASTGWSSSTIGSRSGVVQSCNPAAP